MYSEGKPSFNVTKILFRSSVKTTAATCPISSPIIETQIIYGVFNCKAPDENYPIVGIDFKSEKF